jgi:hypothetical protein
LGNTTRVPKIYSSQQCAEKKISLTHEVLAAAGYNDIQQFYDSVKSASHADHIVLLIFANTNGRSYAQPSASERRDNRYLESALIYDASENNYTETNYGTIMHEMLHLFGAWDMYHSETRNFDMEAKINGVFKNSVMLNDRNETAYFGVDQLTAWRIGWTKTYFSWYEMFRPNTGKYWTALP